MSPLQEEEAAGLTPEEQARFVRWRYGSGMPWWGALLLGLGAALTLLLLLWIASG